MAQYDPQRSRSRHRSGEDEGPAPVDALLGPAEPELPPVIPPVVDLTDGAAAAAQMDPAFRPTPREREPIEPAGARSMAGAVAAFVAVLVAVLLLVAAVARRRRRAD